MRTYVEVTDRLMELGIKTREIAAALGVSRQTAQVYRIPKDSKHWRRPPDNWRSQLIKLLEERSNDLQKLAQTLKAEDIEALEENIEALEEQVREKRDHL